MEVFPIFIALPVMWATYRRFPLTNLLYVLIALHALVLIVGGKYSYARVPFGFELESWLHLGRNPYDKIGHFFQGFVPALVAREVLIRGANVRGRAMLAFVVVCIVLVLGTQGDPWDTQSDMLCALLGGASALVFLARLHDRYITGL